jgi:hypothetical protein
MTRVLPSKTLTMSIQCPPGPVYAFVAPRGSHFHTPKSPGIVTVVRHHQHSGGPGQGNRTKIPSKATLSVIPAQAGIHPRAQTASELGRWTPAFARVTVE